MTPFSLLKHFIIIACFLSPILFLAFTFSRISDDDLAEWHKGLERQVRRNMGIKKIDKEGP